MEASPTRSAIFFVTFAVLEREAEEADRLVVVFFILVLAVRVLAATVAVLRCVAIFRGRLFVFCFVVVLFLHKKLLFFR